MFFSSLPVSLTNGLVVCGRIPRGMKGFHSLYFLLSGAEIDSAGNEEVEFSPLFSVFFPQQPLLRIVVLALCRPGLFHAVE